MEVELLAPGLWRWTAPHPDWTPEEGGQDGWEQEVGCVFLESPDALVLIDPLAPPPDTREAERFWNNLDGAVARENRPVSVLLTVFWHERSAAELLDRYGAKPGVEIWAPEATVPRVEVNVSHAFADGARLPAGLEAYAVERGGEVAYWLPEQRALAVGDVLLGSGEGAVRVCPDSWLPQPDGPVLARKALTRLLELPIELLLTSHGQPLLADGRQALARALAAT